MSSSVKRVELSPRFGSREEGWKLFHVDEMLEIEILEKGFEEPRLGYMRNDPTMTKVFCEL